MIGTIFDNRFELLEKFEHNGMGDIYVAKDLNEEFNFKIIMKITKPEHAGV